jgi:hypothetical protein
MLGREADPGGLQHWTQKFGPSIDDAEREEFRRSAAAELTSNFEGDDGLLGGFKYAKDLGITDAGLKAALGDDLYSQYQGQLGNIATTEIDNIVADNSLTFEESQKVAKFARDLGFDAQQLADLTGKDKSLFDTVLTSYDTNRDRIINETLTGSNVQTDADRVVAAYALEKQFGFTDEELSQATGVDVDVIKNSLNPVRNFETDFSTIANNTDSTTQQIKDFVADAKSNPAIAKLYGDSLSGYENKVAELEEKWSRFGTDAVQSENLFQQLNAQKEALGGQYYQGAFGDLENAAAQLVQKGLDSMGDLGQKDKFQPTMAEARYTTLDGRPVVGDGAGRFGVISGDGESQEWTEIPRDQVNTVYGKYVGSGEDFAFEPLSTQELETLKDGVFQQKLGSVVIDKDTGKELTGLDGNLLYQRTGGHLKGRKHYLTANFTDEGVPYLTASQEKSGLYAAVSDLGPMVISIASVIPGPHQPFAMAANAALAASQKNYLGAVLSGLGAYGTFTGNELATLKAAEASGDIINASQVLDLQNTAANVKLAQTAINGISALQQENLAGVINASLSAYGQTGGTLPSGATTALQAVNLASAIESGNVSSALVALGDLTGSKDLHVAASAKNLIDAIETGNISNIAQAGGAFANSFQAANQARETTDTGGITNRITDDMTEAGAAAFADAKRAGASDADALEASNALTRIAEANETFDGSGFDTQNAAMNAAIAEGLDKFTFGGKTFTIDNSAAQIKDFENSVAAEVKAANDLRAKSDPEFGDLAGAQAAATARNTVAIGNTEADNPEEAAYLAKVRDPSATSFTFDGKTYTISASQSQMAEANRTAALAEIKDLPNFNDAYAQARTLLGPGQTFPWFNPATGKVEQKSTATAAERPDLNITSGDLAIEKINAKNLATTTPEQQALIDAQTDTAARDAAAIETAKLAAQSSATKSMGNTSFLGQIYKDLNEQFRLQGVAANEYLKNNPNSPITESVSSAFEAAGELSRNLGGAVLALDNKPLADAIIKGGERLQAAGQSIGSGPQDTKNWKDTIDLIDKAKGFEKVAVIAGRIMDGTSGLARQVELELRQELPALFLGGGLLRPTLIASGLIDTADTGGAAVIDAYEDVVKKGGTHQEGLLAGRKAGAAAAATEAAIQLTLGKLGDFAAGKLDDVLSKGATKIGSEGVVEGSQEAGASAAVDLALGNAIDINKALTQGVLGAAVGKGTATATSGVDAAQTDALNQTASNAGTAKSTATDLGAIGATRPGAEVVTGGDLGSIGSITPGGDVVIGGAGALGGVNLTAGSQTTVSVADAQQTMADLGLNVSDSVAVNLATQINNAAASTSTGALTGASAGSLTGAAAGTITAGTVAADISSKVTTQIGSGADAASVVGSTITSSLGGGADAATVINSSVTAAINAGGSASTVVGSSVAAAVTAGADASTAVGSAVTSAVTAGADVAATVGSSVSAAVTAGADVNAAAGSSVAAAVTAGANTAATVDSAVTAAITAGADVAVVVDSSVAAAVNSGGNVSTAVDAAVTAAVNAGSNVSVAVDSAVTAAVNAGGNVNTAVGSSVTAAINSGANVTTAVESAVTAAANAGTSVDAAVASSVAAAVNTGANVNTAVTAAVDAAVNAGNNVTVATNANVTTVTNATTNTTTNINTNTGVATTVNANTNVTTTVDASTNTTTVVDANTNTTSQTKVDTNANTQTTVVADTNANTNTQTVVNSNTNTTTSTTVDTNTNTTTQTTTNANTNTQTTVVTDTNTNTQTTIKVNTETGDLIEQKETKVPDDWKPPVIEPPVIPPSVTPPPVTTTTTPPKEPPTVPKVTPRLSDESRIGAGGIGLPVGMDLNPASLRSRETQKAIDPLARVKEIQAEFEREAMIQNVDPRLMQILQQRADPQQQSQQFDKDIGALSKLLGGTPDAPSSNASSNASSYYSYGSEDSIDDILGGKAANYKEGGFVEPLKASGGSMALPLLAKAGGALGHYKGRENFKEGKHVAGEGDGQSDDIPAWLADGEFVFPADVVSALGNGSTKAGTDKLYEMMHGIRDRARSKGPKDLPPPALKSPLDYLKSSKRSTT